MKLPDVVLFDLDGTLIDSVPDLTTALNRMLQELSMSPVEQAIVHNWVGDGSRLLVHRAMTGRIEGLYTDAGLAHMVGKVKVHLGRSDAAQKAADLANQPEANKMMGHGSEKVEDRYKTQISYGVQLSLGDYSQKASGVPDVVDLGLPILQQDKFKPLVDACTVAFIGRPVTEEELQAAEVEHNKLTKALVAPTADVEKIQLLVDEENKDRPTPPPPSPPYDAADAARVRALMGRLGATQAEVWQMLFAKLFSYMGLGFAVGACTQLVADHPSEKHRAKYAEARAKGTQGEDGAKAVRLESELMEAEAAAADKREKTARLEHTVGALREQQKLASDERVKEAARVRALEQQADAAESRASAKAERLRESEASAAGLQSQLEELKRALAASSAPTSGAPSLGRAAASSGVSTRGASAQGDGGDGAVAASSKPPAVPAGAATSSSAPAAPSSPAAANTLDAEAAQLIKEIEVQVGKAGGGGGGRSILPSGGVGGAAPATALSKMKKAELVAECEARTLDAKGSVAELRAQLRVERKRDRLVEQLVERGWSERQARGALAKVGWDVDSAIAKLVGR